MNDDLKNKIEEACPNFEEVEVDPKSAFGRRWQVLQNRENVNDLEYLVFYSELNLYLKIKSKNKTEIAEARLKHNEYLEQFKAWQEAEAKRLEAEMLAQETENQPNENNV